MTEDCPHNNEELSEDGWTVFCQDCFEVLNGEDEDEDEFVDVAITLELTNAWESHSIRVPSMWSDDEIKARIGDRVIDWLGMDDSGSDGIGTVVEVHR